MTEPQLDDLRERLMRVEARRERPRVAIPDVDSLASMAKVRGVRRIAMAALAVVAVGLAVTQWRTQSQLTPESRELPPLDLRALRVAETSAAMRFAVALRTPEPRSQLEELIATFPDTISAQRAADLLADLLAHR